MKDYEDPIGTPNARMTFGDAVPTSPDYQNELGTTFLRNWKTQDEFKSMYPNFLDAIRDRRAYQIENFNLMLEGMCRAFIDETGCKPSEAEIVTTFTPTGSRTWIRKREKSLPGFCQDT